MMRCLYCEREYDEYDFFTLFLGHDGLCRNCREQLVVNHHYRNLEGLKVECLYEYDSLFKTLLLQYKECYDEALKDVFLCRYYDYLRVRYHAYQLVYVPSSQRKLKERGFDHLRLLFEPLQLADVAGLHCHEELVQEGKNAGERRRMRDNYYYLGPALNKVLIVDDVMTTGSSLLGVYAALKNHATKIAAFVLSDRQKVRNCIKNPQ